MNEKYSPLRRSKVTKNQIYWLTISGLFYLFSLTQTAISSNDLTDKSISGFASLIAGGIVILGGGTLEWLIWLANPLYFISIYLFIKEGKNARFLSTIATFIALSFLAWENILVSESGRTGKIDSLGYGYWTWLISLFILTTGIFYSKRPEDIGARMM